MWRRKLRLLAYEPLPSPSEPGAMTVPRQPRNPQRGKVLLWLLVFFLLGLLLLTLYLVRGPLLRAFADWWIVEDPLEKAQAIVVLGGDNRMGERVRHAAELYHTGWAPRVVLSGMSYRTYFNEVTLMEREATNLGIPREHLVVFPQSGRSTLEEALALRAVLAEHHWRKIIVVTSNYHTRRTRRIFHGVYRRHGTQVLISAAPDSDFNPQRWWRQRTGRALLGLELLKSIQTWWELLEPPPPPPALICLPASSAL